MDAQTVGRPPLDAEQIAFTSVEGGFLADPAVRRDATLQGRVSASRPTGNSTEELALGMSFARPLASPDASDHSIAIPAFLQVYFQWVEQGSPRPQQSPAVQDVMEDIILAYNPTSSQLLPHGPSRRVHKQVNLWSPSSSASSAARLTTTLPLIELPSGWSLTWDFTSASGSVVSVSEAAAAASGNGDASDLEAPTHIRFNFRASFSLEHIKSASWTGMWCAVGFGTEMPGSDVLAVRMEVEPGSGQVKTGFPRVEDMYASSYAHPTLDTDASDVQMLGGGYLSNTEGSVLEAATTALPKTTDTPPATSENGMVVVSITIARALVPVDAQDAPISMPPYLSSFFQSMDSATGGNVLGGAAKQPSVSAVYQDMIFASGLKSPTMAYHGIDGRARARVNLFATPSDSVVEPGSLDLSLEITMAHMVHGATMGIAWGVITPLSIIALKYASEHKAFVIDLHHALMNVVGTITIPTATSAFAAADVAGRAITAHGYIGVAIAFLTVVQIAFGQAAKSYYTSTSTPAWVLRRFKQSHVLLGLAMFPTALASVYLGVQFFAATPGTRWRTTIPIVWYGCLAALVLALEARNRWEEHSAHKRMGAHSPLSELDKALKQAKEALSASETQEHSLQSPYGSAKSLSRAASMRFGRAASLSPKSSRVLTKADVAAALAGAPPAKSNSVLLGQAMFGSMRRIPVPQNTSLTSSCSDVDAARLVGLGPSRAAPPHLPRSLLQDVLEKVQRKEMSMEEASSYMQNALTLAASVPSSRTETEVKAHTGLQEKRPPPVIIPEASPAWGGRESHADCEPTQHGPAGVADGERIFTPAGVPVVSFDEFEQQVAMYGEKLTIVGGFVYDVGEYAQQHPGSAFVINKAVGKDVTAQFLGTDTVDPRIPEHAHSARAKVLLSKMLVAVLDTSAAGLKARNAALGGCPAAGSDDPQESEPHTHGTAVPSPSSWPAWGAWCCCRKRKTALGRQTSDTRPLSQRASRVAPSPPPTARQGGARFGRSTPVTPGVYDVSKDVLSETVTSVSDSETVDEQEAEASSRWAIAGRARVSPPVWSLDPKIARMRARYSPTLAAQRPVTVFLLNSQDAMKVPSISDWDSFGLHIHVLQGRGLSQDEVTGELVLSESELAVHDAVDDMLAMRRSFSVVRIPIIFAQHMANLTEEAAEAWRRALRAPAVAGGSTGHAQIWVRRFPAPMGRISRYIHDFGGGLVKQLRAAGPSGKGLGLPDALASCRSGSGSALVVAVCAGTGLAPFLDVIYTLLTRAVSPESRPGASMALRVHLHVLAVCRDVASGVALPFLAMAAAESARRMEGHSISVHMHFTSSPECVTLQDLYLPPSLQRALRQQYVCGVHRTGTAPWLRLSTGSLRDMDMAKTVLLCSLTGASQTLHAVDAAGRAASAQDHSALDQLAKLWVCGPPGMVDVVEEALFGHERDGDAAALRWAKATSPWAATQHLQSQVKHVKAVTSALDG